MEFVKGFLTLLLGSFMVWMGAFQMITAMVPKDIGLKFAENHGAWCRENLFNLPPIKEKDNK